MPARFVLDVHLGTLARRLRLVGVDTAYANDAGDDALVEQANASRRVLLTQDRGLLCRRKLWLGAYVRGARPDDQFADVLDRFAPPLAPWTRCPACNGHLSRPRRDRLTRCYSPAPGAPTRRSPAARTAARCTGAAPTASGLSRSSTPQRAPSAMPPVNRSYQRHERARNRQAEEPGARGATRRAQPDRCARPAAREVAAGARRTSVVVGPAGPVRPDCPGAGRGGRIKMRCPRI